MNRAPFFSVIIPTYNRATLLPKAIESVFAQTYTDWELIIIDDASTDNTKEVVEEYSDNRIRYYKNDVNLERSASRNRGIEASKGQYICFLDSDDVFLSQRLELLKSEIEKRQTQVFMVFTDLVYNNGILLSYSNEKMQSYKSIFDFLTDNIIGVPQVCIHRNILENIQFNPDIRIAEDLELWLRIAKAYNVTYFENQPTVMAYEHEERSVNLKKHNSGQQQLSALRYIFSKEHSGRHILKKFKKKRLSNTYFSIAKYYMYNKNTHYALINILKSISCLPFHRQTLHKFYILMHLGFRLIPKEYN